MKDDAKAIARQRIAILHAKAQQIQQAEPIRAQRLADLARRVASRNRIHLPPELKHATCHNCKALLTPSNSHTRIRQTREPHVATTCHNCGHVNRIPLRRKP